MWKCTLIHSCCWWETQANRCLPERESGLASQQKGTLGMSTGCSQHSGQLPAASQMGEFSFTVHPHGNTNRGWLPCLLLLWWSTLTSGFRRKFHFHVFFWGDCLGTENRVLSGGDEMTACPLLLLLEQQTKASVSDTNQKKLPTVQMLLFAWQPSNKAYATVSLENTGKL